MHNWLLIWWKVLSLSLTIQNCILEGYFPALKVNIGNPEGQHLGVWQSLEACGTQPTEAWLAAAHLCWWEGGHLLGASQVGAWVCCCHSQDGDVLALQALPSL